MDENAGEFTGQSCDWYDLPCHMTGFSEWLVGIILFVPRLIVQSFAELIVTVVKLIPVPPSVLQGFAPFFAEAGAGAVWVAEFFALKEGAALVILGLTIRFTLRALPIVF